MRRLLPILMLLVVVLLAACTFRPSEDAMSKAITAHVGAAEAYPMQFMVAENFRFRDIKRVTDDKRTLYAAHADFDFAYTADGATIVAALKSEERATQEKEKRRADSLLEKITLAAAAALSRHGTEQRFDSVKIGDKDSYQGEFTFARNDDGSWRVESADYH
ncbi:MAG TPA: hypothetical protein VKM35_10950 [Arenimonas sp.]|uniref:hypothetical protein n=1 Tax=Arenimonas sp. TaxID=1872635 RepID=UPI002C203D68|nr:hypothetical protein [Arenimonas sp.]HMB57712.1 hypothetical protein [Arenimonas sp.]